ncbi:hypothetical protein GF371_00570 [Candidatus Woesearchaeota archaeon]|nr:hypothetical protein [Candidatus Woesearchaeota archaeon]
MKVIEFMGMPRAGKSTQFELVETVLSYAKKKKVRCLYEAVRNCPLDRKDRFQYNSWSLHHTINRLMEARMQDVDYILVERGIWDHAAFSIALYFDGKISKQQYLAQRRYCKGFGFLEDTVLAFFIDPETSVEREQKYHNQQGIVTNINFLSYLFEAYKRTIKKVEQKICIIDSSKPLEENTEEIFSHIEQL